MRNRQKLWLTWDAKEQQARTAEEVEVPLCHAGNMIQYDPFQDILSVFLSDRSRCT